MPAPLPIRERCLAQLATQLSAIVAGNPAGKPGNGTLYSHTPANVERWDQEGPDLSAVPAIVISADQETGAEGPAGAPLELIKQDLEVEVAYWIRHDKTADPMVTDKLLALLLADLQLAVMADRTLGGNAEDVEFRGNAPFNVTGREPYAGIILDLVIKYRHSNLDPCALP